MEYLKKISVRDILGIFIFLLLIIPTFIRKHIFKKKSWLICEHLTARDNGYSFFKYMRENHSEIECFYAMDLKHGDYEKVKKLGNVISWGSIKHYYYYMSAEWNISSHKNGNPNHPLFSLLLKYFNLYNNRIFLQHGITYNNHKMFYKKNAKFKLFIVGASPEAKYIKEKFGYSEEEIGYTGFARFDNLHNKKYDKNIILFMPTWRRWLTSEDDLKSSEYYKRIQSFINNKELDELLQKSKKIIYFCPHAGLKKSRHSFSTTNKNVKILDIDKVNIQQLLIKGSLLITDYSSVFFDFSYMKKPLIYYQFDNEDFVTKHIKQSENETYFDFKENGFGEVIENEQELINKISYYINNNYSIEKNFLSKINSFFKLNDTNNCERIFFKIKELERK